jgi:hypothetical protein
MMVVYVSHKRKQNGKTDDVKGFIDLHTKIPAPYLRGVAMKFPE